MRWSRSKRLGSGLGLVAQALSKPSTSFQPNEDMCFATAAEQQRQMALGRLTSQELTRLYIQRVNSLDVAGPKLHSVLELNPEALLVATAMDAERAEKGPRGPLHGVCVLLKDNIDTGDLMNTTAGSLALLDSVPGYGDAPIVARLRAAGAVVLGKANMSEWANYRGWGSDGWSCRGGQCKNPFVLDNSPSGSSSGCAVAVAAGLCSAAVGTETFGSIISPADVNGVCGVKPTVGLVSQTGIVPITADQDTAGPICRSIEDCAQIMTVIAGTQQRSGEDYTAQLKGDGLAGARIGVLRSRFQEPFARDAVGLDAAGEPHEREPMLSEQQSSTVLEQSCLEPLRRAGAVLVEVELWGTGEVESIEPEGLGGPMCNSMHYRFVRDMSAYLATRVPKPVMASMAYLPGCLVDLIEFNNKHKEQELILFGQQIFEEAAQNTTSEEEYRQMRAKLVELCCTHGIDKVIKDQQLDAIVCPSSTASYPASVVGHPIVTVPAGDVRGVPFGCSFIGSHFSEARLIQLAHDFEQATKAIERPTYRPTIEKIPLSKL